LEAKVSLFQRRHWEAIAHTIRDANLPHNEHKRIVSAFVEAFLRDYPNFKVYLFRWECNKNQTFEEDEDVKV
jgi:hypothetical protein